MRLPASSMEDSNYILDSAIQGLLLVETAAEAESWHCTYANKAAEKLLGERSLTGKDLTDLFPGEVSKALGQTHPDVAVGPEIDFFLSGAQRWLSATPSRLGTRMTISISDITRFKEAVFANQHLLGLYKSLSHSLADNEIILFDKDFQILLSEGTPRFIRLGVDGDLKGKNLNSLFETNSFSYLGEYVSKTFGGHATEVEREINGKFYKAHLYSDSSSDNDCAENMVGVLLLKDVSELNKKQRELEIRVQQLDRSNRELQQFAYVASHDLQEPLRKIMSFGERLQRKYGALLTGDGQEYITRMGNAAQRMETLINDLLSFSRATRSDRQFEWTDLNRIFTQVVADMDMVERTKATIEVADTLPTIIAIPSQMRQLFQNILNNALKFVHAERSPLVLVRCRKVAGADLPLSYNLLPEKDYYIIEIKDNGIGFEQSNAERIFTIFQRLHGRSEYSGSGVGLAICKKIVDNHEGAIFAEGEEDKGATFTIVLPTRQGDATGSP